MLAPLAPSLFGPSHYRFPSRSPNRHKSSNLQQMLKDTPWATVPTITPELILKYIEDLDTEADDVD